MTRQNRPARQDGPARHMPMLVGGRLVCSHCGRVTVEDFAGMHRTAPGGAAAWALRACLFCNRIAETRLSAGEQARRLVPAALRPSVRVRRRAVAVGAAVCLAAGSIALLAVTGATLA